MADWKNRTIFTGDNLDVMRGLPDGMADLIYLDPPFNSNRDYAAPIGSKAAGAHFKDTWTLDDVDLEWWGEISESNPALYAVLDAAKHAGGRSAMSYLAYMGIRILEMRRILKGAGALCIHCDSTMSHYLKLALDAVFGRANFRNEIVWKRSSGHPLSIKKFDAVTDTILFYQKSDRFAFRPVRIPQSAEWVDRQYRHKDGRGRYYHCSLTGGKGGGSPHICRSAGRTHQGAAPGRLPPGPKSRCGRPACCRATMRR